MVGGILEGMEKRKRNWFFWVFNWSDFRKENWWDPGVEPRPTKTQSPQIGKKILTENKELLSVLDKTITAASTLIFWTYLFFLFLFLFLFCFCFFQCCLTCFFFLFCFGCSSSHVFLFSPVLGSWIFFCYFFFYRKIKCLCFFSHQFWVLEFFSAIFFKKNKVSIYTQFL